MTLEEKRLEEQQEIREAALKALKNLLENGEVESYSFSDGSGSQNVRRRSIKDLQEALKDSEKEIEELEKKVYGGGGIRTFSTNRYG